MDVSNSNKTDAVIKYLLGLDDNPNNSGCDAIKRNKLFFNFINAKEDTKQFVTRSSDKALNKTFVDGSVMRRYMFTIIDFRSVTYQAIAKDPNYIDKSENLVEYLDIQAIIDWITEQDELKNYPIFGDKCIIDSMRTTAETPNLNGVDTSVQPVLAKYSMTIQIDYLDVSKRIWN